MSSQDPGVGGKQSRILFFLNAQVPSQWSLNAALYKPPTAPCNRRHPKARSVKVVLEGTQYPGFNSERIRAL